ncbi:DNA polymerase III subunit delta [Deinococcus psychrotolerans]|uniref:DNA-directed DNA polymerase n=1 Tax=Deinococcus psychrotolerans TaxID=2489213 RepID=A0A3G8YAF8_9DEIO|nr:DNA polymerase III subunit delta [Deinococcus psychrotolerans]AZI42342.1 DNA polymerase III subunit delta [Deinococcus psychrotolerans]
MILAFSGNRFLIEEAARESLAQRGLHLRDLPRLSGEDVTPPQLASLLAPSLFGESAALVDLEGVRPDKALLESLATPGALVIILDPLGAATRVKHYQQHGEHVAVPSPSKTGEVAGWVASRAKASNLKLAKEAALYLAEVFGTDLAGIAAELNKLAFLAGPPNGSLGRELVQQVVGRETPGDSFVMLGAATAGRPAEALGQLRRLLSSGEDPFKLMGAVVWQYSLVARSAALLQEGGRVSETEAAQRLGVKPYPAKKALEVARKLTEGQVRSHLSRILEADLAMKRGMDVEAVMERLLVELSL